MSEKWKKVILPKFSVGVGDRFAHQAKAQLSACLLAVREGVEAVTVWNKSNREHLIIGLEPDETRRVADAAIIEVVGRVFDQARRTSRSSARISGRFRCDMLPGKAGNDVAVAHVPRSCRGNLHLGAGVILRGLEVGVSRICCYLSSEELNAPSVHILGLNLRLVDDCDPLRTPALRSTARPWRVAHNASEASQARFSP